MSKNFILVMGNKNYSSWSLRPWLLLKQFNIPFKEVILNLGQPGSKAEILKHSPSGKVPVLKHGKMLVWESLAIAEYLADLFSAKKMWPQDKEARALARAVCSEMHAGFINLRKACPMNVRAHRPDIQLTEEVKRDIARIFTIWELCRKKYRAKGPFLFGKFSIADAMYAPVVFRFKTYGIELKGEVKKYSDTMLALPVIKEWQEAAINEKHIIEGH